MSVPLEGTTRYQVEYRVDEVHGLAYISLPPGGEVKGTIRIAEDIVIDVNADGELVGIELLKLRWP